MTSLLPSSHPAPTFRRRSRRLLPAAALLLALPLAGCGAEDDTDAGSAAGDGSSGAAETYQPVTIEHAFGTTEIDERPERVVTWGWGSSDAVLALGVMPVAIPQNSYGADDEGYMPWQKDAVDAAISAGEESGEEVEAPTLLTEGAEVPFEEVAAAAPDVIVANYSGITQDEYDKLSQIAPTVAYPDEPWSTPWRDVITTVGDVLGRADEADDLLESIDADVAEAAEAHPEFDGLSIAAVAIDPDAFYVYKPADPRVQFLEDLGFTSADSVDELQTDEATFYYTLSTERVDQLTSDVLLSYNEEESQIADQAADPALGTMGQFQDDAVASVVGESLISSVSPPTALSLTWGLDSFVEALVPAAEQARAEQG